MPLMPVSSGLDAGQEQLMAAGATDGLERVFIPRQRILLYVQHDKNVRLASNFFLVQWFDFWLTMTDHHHCLSSPMFLNHEQAVSPKERPLFLFRLVYTHYGELQRRGGDLRVLCSQIELYMYNWAADIVSKLIQHFSLLVQWHNARSHLLTNIISQKMGLYQHHPFEVRAGPLKTCRSQV